MISPILTRIFLLAEAYDAFAGYKSVTSKNFLCIQWFYYINYEMNI